MRSVSLGTRKRSQSFGAVNLAPTPNRTSGGRRADKLPGAVQIAREIRRLTPRAVDEINTLAKRIFRTRGGRVGSGMGLLLEALWGYFVNTELERAGQGVEIGWIATHEYNDFACLVRDSDWDPAQRHGEVLRIEIKSMISSADESKAHFDRLAQELGEHDLLVVLLWDWEPLDRHRLAPVVRDYFVGSAKAIAQLRDALHLARGGSFVDSKKCPDGCDRKACTHHGEPLNAAGKRERGTGPASTKPANVGFAANFGGLVRMLKTRGVDAHKSFQRSRRQSDDAHRYVSFIHRNLAAEELSQYSLAAWKNVGRSLGVDVEKLKTASAIRDALVRSGKEYQELLSR